MKNNNDASKRRKSIPKNGTLVTFNLLDASFLRNAHLLLEVNSLIVNFLEAGSPIKGVVLCALLIQENTSEALDATSVKEVARLIGASNTTVYNLLKELEDEGKVFRMVGKGRAPDTYFVDRNVSVAWFNSDDGRNFDKEISNLLFKALFASIPQRFLPEND